MTLGLFVGLGFGVAFVSAFAVVLIWGGYPLMMRALARRRPPPAGSSLAPTFPTVSVVLATRDSPEAVAARVANLLDTSYPADRLDIVVSIAAGSDAGLYAGDDARVRIVVADVAGGKWANLNAGVTHATGEILVFADTAQRFERGTISALVSAFALDAVAGVTGWLALPASVPGAVRAYWGMERALRRDEATLHSSIGVTGAVWALRRALWAPLPPGLILDDVYTPMRLVLGGHRIVVSEAAIAHDTRAPHREAEFERKVRTLTGVYQVCALLPGILRPGRNPVWWQFVAHKLLRLWTPWFVLVAVVAGGTALAALLQHYRLLAPVAGILVLLSALALLSPARRVMHGLWDALHLQFAAVRATQNAMRGRWDVWR